MVEEGGIADNDSTPYNATATVPEIIDLFDVTSPVSIVGDLLVLLEWRDYAVLGEGIDELEILGPGGEGGSLVRQRIFMNFKVYEFRFENQLGLTRLKVRIGGRIFSRGAIVVTDKLGLIYPDKCSASDSDTGSAFDNYIACLLNLYNDFFARLTRDITKWSSQLNFEIRSPTGFATSESTEPISELFVYHFLKTRGKDIIRAYETILRRMKKELVVEHEVIVLSDVGEVSPETVFWITQHPEQYVRAPNTPLGRRLKGYVPANVLAEVRYESPDTHENRFAKHFLKELLMWGRRTLSAMMRYYQGSHLEGIKSLVRRLEIIAANASWAEVGEMTVFPYTSQVLLKRDGYRDLLQLWREFKAYSPFFSELKRAIENKDVAKLYEYWVLMKLVQEIKEVLHGPDTKLVIELGRLREGVRVDFGEHVLYYNRCFSRLGKPGSYSVNLVPDYALLKKEGRKTRIIGVFDAKFKIVTVSSGSVTVKDEDIHKMHTYRDALGSRYAVAIYPGHASRFWHKSGEAVEGVTLKQIIKEEPEGVGYIALKPSL